jgi:RNA polymerase sigma factor (sigma-70 family)
MPGDTQPENLSQPTVRSGRPSQAHILHPVDAALGDLFVLRRLHNAASAMLRAWHRDMPSRQRRAEAEEVVQEAAERALARRAAYDRERSVIPWLVGFVAIVCRERTRGRAAVITAQPPGNATGQALEDLLADLSRPCEEALADRLDSRQILERLPADDRDLLRLRFFANASALEIGKRLGISEAAARVRLFRVLTRLKGEMAATEEQQ